MTSYDGNAITYDAIGNPTSDGVWNYTWKHGRQLASMTSVSGSSNPSTITYTYDADGMRTSKTVSTYGTVIRYEYVYRGGLLMQEVIKTTTGTGEDATVTTNTLNYFYDGRGLPAAVTYNGTIYYYVVNGQGDVIALTDANSSIVVSYVYDAWGNILTTTGTLADTLGAGNALRYRSYVYDTETDLYYLQSRYYNPEIGRFLNADAFAATGQGTIGNNMFAYCLNSPTNGCDPCGYCFHRWDCWNDCAQCGGKTLGDKLSMLYDDVVNFDWNNTSESTAIQSNYFSAYKGQLVIRQDWAITNGRSGSFGVMFLNSNVPNNPDGVNTVRHEYGHYLHMKEIGVVAYTIMVPIPSITTDSTNYYSAPWEYTADQYGGVVGRTYLPDAPASAKKFQDQCILVSYIV